MSEVTSEHKPPAAAAAAEEKKPTVGEQSAATTHINLKVKDQDNNEVFFRIRRDTQLKKLMTAYCEKQSIEFGSAVFLLDGTKILGHQTPAELEMENNDEIDAMLHQSGGSTAQ